MKFKQYAALPFRTCAEAGLEVLLITTRKKRRWSIPKGWRIGNETPHGTAAIEAFEEAGLSGQMQTKSIGRYKHRRAKKRMRVMCDVQVFPMQVEVQSDAWPEKGQRALSWVPAGKAAELVHKPGLKKAIRTFEQRHR